MPIHRRGAYGFTLIEVLVVVLLVGILLSVVVTSFTGVDREQELRGYVERLALRIELARDKALQANKEWGVYVNEDGVSFAVFDDTNGEWMPQGGRHFTADSYSQTLDFDVEVESFEGNLVTLEGEAVDAEDEKKDFPTIVLFSSGETTPFTISLTPKDWDSNPWQLASDGFSRTEVSRPEQI